MSTKYVNPFAPTAIGIGGNVLPTSTEVLPAGVNPIAGPAIWKATVAALSNVKV